MHSSIRRLGIAAALAAGLVLASCGGDDFNSPPPVTSEVPASASTSIGGFIDYLKELVVSSADMLEPVDVASVTAPTDETSDPTPLP